jgi:hypothetical protein
MFHAKQNQELNLLWVKIISQLVTNSYNNFLKIINYCIEQNKNRKIKKREACLPFFTCLYQNLLK